MQGLILPLSLYLSISFAIQLNFQPHRNWPINNYSGDSLGTSVRQAKSASVSATLIVHTATARTGAALSMG